MTSNKKPINSQSRKVQTCDVSLTSDVRCRCHVAGNPKHSSDRSCSSRLPSYIVVALQLTSEWQHDIGHLTAGNIAKALSLHRASGHVMGAFVLLQSKRLGTDQTFHKIWLIMD